MATPGMWNAQQSSMAPPGIWQGQQHGGPPQGALQFQQNNMWQGQQYSSHPQGMSQSQQNNMWQGQQHGGPPQGALQSQQNNMWQGQQYSNTSQGMSHAIPPTSQQNINQPQRMGQSHLNNPVLVKVEQRRSEQPGKQNESGIHPGQKKDKVAGGKQQAPTFKDTPVELWDKLSDEQLAMLNKKKSETKKERAMQKFLKDKERQRKEKASTNKQQVPAFKDTPLELWDSFSEEQLAMLNNRKSETKKEPPYEKIFKEIKRARYYLDFVTDTDFWTTAREKNLVKLGLRDNNLPEDVIKHVVTGYCLQKFHVINGNYVCSYGFVLKQGDVAGHIFENCHQFHELTRELRCDNGRVYYPVDPKMNPFAQWKNDSLSQSKNAKVVYEMIARTWPYHCIFGEGVSISHCASFQERYLIHLMESGLDVPKEVIYHVVRGCEVKPHKINDSLWCHYGFLLTTSERFSHDDAMKDPENLKNAHIGRIIANGKPMRDPARIDYLECEVNHKLNDKIKCSHGNLYYELHGCSSLCKVMRFDRKKEFRVLFVDNPGVQAVYFCLKYKSQFEKKGGVWYEDLRAWEEYLLKLIVDGMDIPIEVICHVIDGLDGCYIGPHRLDNSYGCCNGFILTMKEFNSHDFGLCQTDHSINEELRCNKGQVYHVLAPKERPTSGMPHLAGQLLRKKKIIEILCPEDVPNPQVPPAPAPPPPDLLE